MRRSASTRSRPVQRSSRGSASARKTSPLRGGSRWSEGAGHADYVARSVSGGSLVLTLIGYGVMALGGWLGGAIVFVHGMRVLNLVEEPTDRAVSPLPHPEKEEAEGA